MPMSASLLFTLLIVAAAAVTVVRAVLRPNREPAARLAWVVVILAVPIVGILAYWLIGETKLSERRRFRGKAIDEALPRPPGDKAALERLRQGRHDAPFALARTINRLDPTQGNKPHLAADSDTAVDEMCRDADRAAATVHACFYIWLDDTNGLKIKDAFIRAARRGVNVRVLADALGSYRFIRSAHWRDLRTAGVDARVALPVGNLVMTLIRGRIDLRNHRKSLVIDNEIAWVGSQNAADPEFRIKPNYAPWVDIMTRWEGPVAQHCQFLFVSDWMSEGGEDLTALLKAPPPKRQGTAIAQVIGTGPTLRFDSMPNAFDELIHSARHELVVTTPYFVPDEMLLFSLTSAARRGVRTILVIPKRIDSRIVAATCKSYFEHLIEAGVELYRYRPGLLHAKTMVVDHAVGLVGSANLDRRSFELNFENNILFADEAFARQVRDRQESYIADSDRVRKSDVEGFTLAERVWNNFVAMMSPLL